MAEYWKSAPRFWCKQCKIFIRDTPFEKTQHEASGKHQSNLKRFLREIHKDNERQQKETQRAQNEVERLRHAVGGGSATTAAGDAPWKRSAVSPPKPAERPASLEERKKQMAQLADMGIAIPQEYRADMALAGEWQTLSETKLQPQYTGELESAAKSVGVRKRKHEGDGDEEDEHAPEQFVSKGWGSKTRGYPGGTQVDEDLDTLLASTKDIKKPKMTTAAVESEELTKESTSAASKEEQALDSGTKSEAAQVMATEPDEAAARSDLAETPKSAEAAPEVVFKKRKPKGMRK